MRLLKTNVPHSSPEPDFEGKPIGGGTKLKTSTTSTTTSQSSSSSDKGTNGEKRKRPEPPPVYTPQLPSQKELEKQMTWGLLFSQILLL